MSDDDHTVLERALDDHGAFDPTGDRYEVTTTPFEARVGGKPAESEGRDAEVTVDVSVPTLDAAVSGEPVADVVEDGWFDSLSLHLTDAPAVAEVDEVEDPTIERTRDEVRVHVRFAARDAERGVADAKAVVDYIEGTYVQAVIPGYEYGEPVAGLLSQAADSAGDGGTGAHRGGTPL